MEQFQLTAIADHLISEVSGGERQRALIARALVQDPDIIIADEPTSNIDIHREKEVFSIFEQLHKKGKTLIVVSHDIFLLKKYATSPSKGDNLHSSLFKGSTRRSRGMGFYSLFTNNVSKMIQV